MASKEQGRGYSEEKIKIDSGDQTFVLTTTTVGTRNEIFLNIKEALRAKRSEMVQGRIATGAIRLGIAGILGAGALAGKEAIDGNFRNSTICLAIAITLVGVPLALSPIMIQGKLASKQIKEIKAKIQKPQQ